MLSPAAVMPILLLVISNVFMTAAWYWHLRFTEKPIVSVILISWLLAGVEYCFAIPANRIGYQVYSAAQLKTLQEIITILVFAIFSFLYLHEALRWNHAVAFLCLVAA